MMRSNLNLDSIKRSLSGLSESIKTAKTNSDQISVSVTKRNAAKRESLSMSSKLFARRRDNMRRRDKEDLIEAGGVMGAFKARARAVRTQTKGFLGRILDFLATVLIGWAVLNLPKIIKLAEGVMKRLSKFFDIVGGFVTSTVDFFTGLGVRFSEMKELVSKFDFVNVKNQIEKFMRKVQDAFTKITITTIRDIRNFLDKKLLFETFPKISYSEAMLKYGSDKPDLRNPLVISDVTKLFERDDISFEIFKKLVRKGSIVRSIVTKNTKDKPRSFFDGIDKWAKEQGSSGLAYFSLEKNDKIIGKGPVGKFFSEESLMELMKITNAEIGDTVFLSCGKQNDVEKILSIARTRIAEELKIIKEDCFAFCWIVDYPMFEIDEQTKKISFSHNPFSMPQGDIKNLDLTDPLSLKAYQYDIVCNGIELSSGAIRNHVPELMYKLFDIAGYSKKDVEEKFSGMINALSYGAPPHGGIAPGIDRIVMLLADEKNIREVTMFPMNQNAQDLMMNAPSTISEDQLKELNLTVKKKT